MDKKITLEQLNAYEAAFDGERANQVADAGRHQLRRGESRPERRCVPPGPASVLHLPGAGEDHSTRSSAGRCWMFAALNTMRCAAMKKLGLEDTFELSAGRTPLFFDKLEKRTNYFLESHPLATLEEPLDGRVMANLLSVHAAGRRRPVGYVLPPSWKNTAWRPRIAHARIGFHSSNTREMNKLHDAASCGSLPARSAHGAPAAAGPSEEALRGGEGRDAFRRCITMLCVSLGKPPKTVAV